MTEKWRDRERKVIIWEHLDMPAQRWCLTLTNMYSHSTHKVTHYPFFYLPTDNILFFYHMTQRKKQASVGLFSPCSTLLDIVHTVVLHVSVVIYIFSVYSRC